jgi:hypothetical protein
VLAGACFRLAGAGVGSCSAWSSGLTRGFSGCGVIHGKEKVYGSIP